MSHRKPPASVREKRLAYSGVWPNRCKCGETMQFAYGPGKTVQERAAGAFRLCPCGTKVTASDVMRNRMGHSET